MKNKTTKYLLTVLPLLLLSGSTWAQADAEAGADPYFYDRFLSSSMILAAAAVVIASIVALYNLLNIMVKVQQIRIYEEQGIEAYQKEVKKPKESTWQRLYKRWTAAVPLEKEEDILFDHEYDGIRELDNSLPPWWVAMFYITIAFAVVYFSYYHIFDAGPGSREEYKMEMEQAEKAVQAYLSTQANLVDESNVSMITDEDALAQGKTIFETNCAACHGFLGEGGVGPNMTDQYWIHGGSIKDVFKTIKYGVPEKGMIAWKSQMGASEMHKVASYILTLVGTNPPNAKEAEGELYQGEQVDNSVPADTSTTKEEATDDAIGMKE